MTISFWKIGLMAFAVLAVFAALPNPSMARSDGAQSDGAQPDGAQSDGSRKVGFAKADITPAESLRLSGYSRRDDPFESVESPLACRAMAIQSGQEAVRILASVDTIGLPSVVVDSIAKSVSEKYQIKRSDIAICCTHTHTAPSIEGCIKNLLRKPPSDAESDAIHRYTERIKTRLVQCVGAAIDNLQPAKLSYGEGKATFAINRRVIKQGKWVTFGETPTGPVDHCVGVLKVNDAEGKLMGVVFNYACHCTTLDATYNKVCGDWAGDAARTLETSLRGEDRSVIAMCTIGCGADANPSPRSSRADALMHGQELASEVSRVIMQETKPLGKITQTDFAYVALPFDLPTREELEQNKDSNNAVTARHANHMLDILAERKRLPANYPMPIQTWQFGDDFKMIFLGGEVVAEYALRLQKELPDATTWVSAYTNDVFGYVASERMRSEGGYEVDFSMIYYLLPGRFASGTEDLIIQHVHKSLAKSNSQDQDPKTSLHVPDGWTIDLVAMEPLVQDPIHIAFAEDDSLWVVEMGNYPLGNGDGRVKHLFDDDGDGVFDRADVFADGLNYPTSVFPWRDGVLVTAAPELLHLRDTDGDGKSDSKEVLFEGFAEANPQHRFNGFAIGLDGRMQLAGGDDTKVIQSKQTGKETKVSRHDIAIDFRTGEVSPLTGFTQFGRYRSDWGDWFGGDNSHPLRHFVVANHYLNRNRHIGQSFAVRDLTQPASAPPVFARSDTNERFNDLFAAGRFTSACSHAPVRDPRLRSAMLRGHQFPADPTTDSVNSAWQHDVVLICEPVHNLVHRAVIQRQTDGLVAVRHDDDAASEWLTSSDPSFRPVQSVTGKDGSAWVVDMHRAVIEHPEWISDVWQERIDLRAGSDQGRIYRINPPSDPNQPSEQGKQRVSNSIADLSHPNGIVRDLAFCRWIADSKTTLDSAKLSDVKKIIRDGRIPVGRATAFAFLLATDHCDFDCIDTALSDRHPGVVRSALQQLGSPGRLAGLGLTKPESQMISEQVVALMAAEDPAVRMEAALLSSFLVGENIADRIADRMIIDHESSLMNQALLIGAHGSSLAVLKSLASTDEGQSIVQRDRDLLATLMAMAIEDNAEETTAWIEEINGHNQSESSAIVAEWALSQTRGRERTKQDYPDSITKTLQDCVEFGNHRTASENQTLTAIRLLGKGWPDGKSQASQLISFVDHQYSPTIQTAALDAIADDGQRSDEILLRQLNRWTPSLQSRVLDRFMQKEKSLKQLVTALEEGTVSPSVLTAVHRNRLLSDNNKSLRVRAGRIFATSSQNAETIINKYRRAFSLAGNQERGQAIFKKTCATCHRLGDQGHEVGPDLGTLSHRDNEFMLRAIFDPNAAIESRYRQCQVLTFDGKLIAGILIEETSDSVTVLAANATKTKIDREDIETIQSATTSLMPTGLERDVSEQDFADLMNFLRAASR